MCLRRKHVAFKLVFQRTVQVAFPISPRSATSSAATQIPVKEQRQLYSREAKGPSQCEVQIMSHYQKLTAVVMGHLIADDGSGNRFSTSGHIVITSFITKSMSCTTQPRNWSCANFRRQTTQFCSLFLSCEDNGVGGWRLNYCWRAKALSS